MPSGRSKRSAIKRVADKPTPENSPAKNSKTKTKTKPQLAPVVKEEVIDEFDVTDDETETKELATETQVVSEVENQIKDPPLQKVFVVDEAKFAKINNHDKATDGKCGHCEGCVRSPCQECSACKRQKYGECIDLYCTNERSGITERVNLREMYLQTLKVQQESQSINSSATTAKDSSGEDTSMDEDDPAEENQVRKTQGEVEDHFTEKNLGHQKKQKNFHASVYGGSSRALKSRRCGECEGCTKDDCGTCTACRDKPRFGGKGTKKKACSGRYCRLKTLYRA